MAVKNKMLLNHSGGKRLQRGEQKPQATYERWGKVTGCCAAMAPLFIPPRRQSNG